MVIRPKPLQRFQQDDKSDEESGVYRLTINVTQKQRPKTGVRYQNI